jgi:hypothetical protein
VAAGRHHRAAGAGLPAVCIYDWLVGQGGEWAAARLAAGGRMAELFAVSALAPDLGRARRGVWSARSAVWLWLVLQAWIERWL